MTQQAASGGKQGLTARADPYDDILDEPGKASARAHDATAYTLSRPVRSGPTVWYVAIAASLVWIAAVAAFCWSYFSLPPDVGAVADAARLRITTGDWLMIVAALLAPLLLIWLVAWLVQRSNEMRSQTRELTVAAMNLANAARSVQAGGGGALPAPLLDGELGETTPRHLRREVERATHAISALHSQMRSIEEALSSQAAAIDDVAERAEKRARQIAQSLGNERTALASLVSRMESAPVAPSISDDAIRERAAQADAVDLSLSQTDGAEDPPMRAAWMQSDEPDLGEPEPSLSPQDASSMPEPEEITLSIGEESGQTRSGVETETVDPFDDIGRAVKAGVAGAAVGGAGVALSGTEEGASGSTDDQPTLDDRIQRGRKHALDWDKFVRAANFPESEDDSETLDALYDVLTDPEAASFLQSAEDTLAALADLDLYMEDFARELSPVDHWVSFVNGKSPQSKSLLGIEAMLEESRVQSKLEVDPGFERLCAKFTERYHLILERMLREGKDPKMLVDLSDTRTGRAYLLIAQALGKITAPVRTTNTG